MLHGDSCAWSTTWGEESTKTSGRTGEVGMGELVMPNKVKIIYMKAIAKVHPDKVSPKLSGLVVLLYHAVLISLRFHNCYT